MNTFLGSHLFCSTTDKTVRLHTSPHYTEEYFKKARTVFGEEPTSGYGHKELDYVYSDRFWQWDWDKAKLAQETANTSNHTPKSCLWYEVFLSTYLDKLVTIEHILAGVNVSNGYSYYVLGYKPLENNP